MIVVKMCVCVYSCLFLLYCNCISTDPETNLRDNFDSEIPHL